jgi:hypothetical protein
VEQHRAKIELLELAIEQRCKPDIGKLPLDEA